MGRPVLALLCLTVCGHILTEEKEDLCTQLGLYHHRTAPGEDGATIVFCRNSTDGTVRGVTHLGQDQVSL